MGRCPSSTQRRKGAKPLRNWHRLAFACLRPRERGAWGVLSPPCVLASLRLCVETKPSCAKRLECARLAGAFEDGPREEQHHAVPEPRPAIAQRLRPERPVVNQPRASAAPPWGQAPLRNRSEGAGVATSAPSERSAKTNRNPGRHSLRSLALGWWTPALWAEVAMRLFALRIPKGFDVNSRGCNPRNRRCAAPALKGPNRRPASPFDPCRVGDCGGGPFSGFHPELFTLRPSRAGPNVGADAAMRCRVLPKVSTLPGDLLQFS